MGQEREKERNFVRGLMLLFVGDCRHHHRHHRSVYKKNFSLPPPFVWGMGSVQNYQKCFVYGSYDNQRGNPSMSL